jgi:adenylate kinase family enzyme
MLDALMKEGKMVPVSITLELIREAMSRIPPSSGILLDGFPRSLDQARAFEVTITPPSFILHFDAPESVLESRLINRGKTSGRLDDNIATIKKRFTTFIETSYAVIQEYTTIGKVVKISSMPPPSEVYYEASAYFIGSPNPARRPSHISQDAADELAFRAHMTGKKNEDAIEEVVERASIANPTTARSSSTPEGPRAWSVKEVDKDEVVEVRPEDVELPGSKPDTAGSVPSSEPSEVAGLEDVAPQSEEASNPEEVPLPESRPLTVEADGILDPAQ